MAQTILTQRQQLLLTLFSQQKDIIKYFYLSGGTALAEYYLHHRLSEDLDFFSFDEFDIIAVQVLLRKIKAKAGIKRVDYTQSFNRNLLFLHFEDEVIKTEFTYYPFQQLEKPKEINNIKTDSLIDIAVNKVFTIYQTPRSRDFIDLYLIMKDQEWSFDELKKKARLKFDTYIDPLQMIQQLLKIKEVKDYPRMLVPFDMKECEEFWLKEAEVLKTEVLK